MNAFGGVWARGRETASEALLERLSSFLQRIEVEPVAATRFGAVGVLQGASSSEDAALPRAKREAGLETGLETVGVINGRLDNASELAHRLGRGPDDSDAAALAIAAYERWGVQGLGRLIGEFSLVLWDARRQTLVLCCDAIGVRSLSYRITDRVCVWSSSSRALLAAYDLPAVADQDYIAAFLLNQPAERSALRDVEWLPPGHALVVTPATAGTVRVWAPERSHTITYTRDEEYERHFRHLLQDAIRCRLGTDASVFCELSGGLDSASIVCVASSLKKGAAAAMPDIRTVSYVFPRARTSDETAYISAVEAVVGRPGFHIADSDAELLTPFDLSSLCIDYPTAQVCFMARQQCVQEEMRRERATVLLSGIGGDQLFWSQPPAALAVADRLAEKRIFAALGAAARCAEDLCWPYVKAFSRGVLHLLPDRFHRGTVAPQPVGTWLHPEFVQRTGFEERRAQTLPLDDLRFALPSRSLHYRLLRWTMRRYALERVTPQGRINVLYPYLDRRLIEFALAIPFEQSVRRGETRSLVRRALRGILPEAVRMRRSKCGPTEALYQAIDRQWPWVSSLIADSRVCALGIARHEELSRSFYDARLGRVSAGVQTQLTRTLSLEIWLRSLEYEASGGAGCAAA